MFFKVIQGTWAGGACVVNEWRANSQEGARQMECVAVLYEATTGIRDKEEFERGEVATSQL